MPEDMGVPREQEKDFDASLSGGGTAADFWANRCDQLKEEIKTLRSDLSKREAEVAAWVGAAKKTFDMMDQIGQTDLCAFYEVNRDTASVAKAHDDKVAREIWKEAVQMVGNHPSHLLAHSHTTESGPCDLCCLTRKFKDKAEQGGKDGA